MSANCRSCGRIMARTEDFPGGDINSRYCSNCTNADGSLKSLDEITLHIANQLIMSQGIDREAATKAARSILSVQPVWKNSFKKDETRKSLKTRILIVSTCLVLAVSLSAVFLVSEHIKNRYDADPFYVYKLGESKTKTGLCKPMNDVHPTNVNGQTVYQIPMEFDQSDLRFNSAGNLEFVIDRNTDARYSIVDFSFSRGQPGTIMAEPLSFELNSRDGYIGAIDGKSYWMTDSHGRDAIKEVSGDPNGMNILGYPFDGNVLICGKMLVWLERGSENQFMTAVMAYNAETGKVFHVDKSDTAKFDLQSGDGCIYWVDSGNPFDSSYPVKGFDLSQRKPVATNIKVTQKTYGYSKPFKGATVIGDDKKIVSLWKAVGDDIVFEDIANQNKLTVFKYETGKFSAIENASYSPIFLTTFWRDPDSIASKDKEFAISHTPQHDVLFDPASKGDGKLLVWQRLNKDQTFSIEYAWLDGNPVAKSMNGEFTPIQVSGQWLVCLKRNSDGESPSVAELTAIHLASGKRIGLGSYNKPSFWNLDGQNGIVAWSAITESGDTDIFYARLP